MGIISLLLSAFAAICVLVLSNAAESKKRSSSSISDVRLSNGDHGILEVYAQGVWGTVCDDWFESADLEVTCRMLGRSPGEILESGSSLYDSYPILLDNVECDGNEATLNECAHNAIGDHNCGQSELVAIRCGESTHGPEAVDGQLRIIGYQGPHEGQLQVFHEGVWGAICDDFFDSDAAEVACREMGYTNGGSQLDSGVYDYESGDSQSFWLDNVLCNGGEPRLIDCGHNPWGDNNCGNHETVNIRCEGAPSATQEPGQNTEDGTVTIMGGETPHEGYLMVYHNNQWGHVCDDMFDYDAATVACRQMGYTEGEMSGRDGEMSRSDNYMGDAVYIADQIWLDSVLCYGQEETILDCQHNEWGDHNCGHHENVYLLCDGRAGNQGPGEESTPDGAVRIHNQPAGGNGPAIGLLEVYYDGVWGTVCDDFFDDFAATAACRSIGYDAGSIHLDNQGYSYGQEDQPIWLDDVQCGPHASNLLDCDYSLGSHNCGHHEDVNVRCYQSNPVTTAGGSGDYNDDDEDYSWAFNKL